MCVNLGYVNKANTFYSKRFSECLNGFLQSSEQWGAGKFQIEKLQIVIYYLWQGGFISQEKDLTIQTTRTFFWIMNHS